MMDKKKKKKKEDLKRKRKTQKEAVCGAEDQSPKPAPDILPSSSFTTGLAAKSSAPDNLSDWAGL